MVPGSHLSPLVPYPLDFPCSMPTIKDGASDTASVVSSDDMAEEVPCSRCARRLAPLLRCRCLSRLDCSQAVPGLPWSPRWRPSKNIPPP